MKSFLSIGEVSKMMGVSIRSLRYYDEIGVLKPAHINQQTGYRYYTLSQSVMLNWILACVDFEVPLKNFDSYKNLNGNFNLQKLLNDGKENIARQKKQITQNEFAIKQMEKQIKYAKEISKASWQSLKKADKRYLLTMDIPFEISKNKKILNEIAHIFTTYSTKLYSKTKEYDVLSTNDIGLIIMFQNGIFHLKIYLEIAKKIKCKEFMLLPEVELVSRAIKYIDLEKIITTEIFSKTQIEGTTFIIRELFNEEFSIQPNHVEIQEFRL